MQKRTLRAAIVTVAMAFAASVSGVGSAHAATVEYWPGKDVTVGSCKGWLNKRTSDGYVQAVAQSWGAGCAFQLQRKRLGTGGYDWTPVSDLYLIKNVQYATGFHWNGTDAGSRVCLFNNDINVSDCGAGAW
ncbi:hypothetical protein GCM10023205_84840 [Yinghuangia aomiensis]|uniref:Secreted protein n=2 Tax=Yinghuangia aomiensis TaxID=676205 RepID=A0ABP9IIN3_9ACTN